MGSDLLKASGLSPSEPLWKRVPSRDESGKSYSDLMMIIPRLGKRPQDEINQRISLITTVLEQYKHVVVFADLNLKLNVLWLSYKPVYGLTYELAAAIKLHIPEAVLVSEQARPPR
ncbi:MAG: hypothetical protein HUJ29_04940 [Gammaproteobacteria bacterium]|nr:hypothetical protein [Gammaproteobacteria bacterium]